MSRTNTAPFYEPTTTNCPFGEMQKSDLFLTPADAGQVYRISSKVLPTCFQVRRSQTLTLLSREVETRYCSSGVKRAQVTVLWWAPDRMDKTLPCLVDQMRISFMWLVASKFSELLRSRLFIWLGQLSTRICLAVSWSQYRTVLSSDPEIIYF